MSRSGQRIQTLFNFELTDFRLKQLRQHARKKFFTLRARILKDVSVSVRQKFDSPPNQCQHTLRKLERHLRNVLREGPVRVSFDDHAALTEIPCQPSRKQRMATCLLLNQFCQLV